MKTVLRGCVGDATPTYGGVGIAIAGEVAGGLLDSRVRGNDGKAAGMTGRGRWSRGFIRKLWRDRRCAR